VDNVWSFYLRDVTFKIDGKEIQLHGGQITACDQKTAATS